jgi:hypothetical protein
MRAEMTTTATGCMAKLTRRFLNPGDDGDETVIKAKRSLTLTGCQWEYPTLTILADNHFMVRTGVRIRWQLRRRV